MKKLLLTVLLVFITSITVSAKQVDLIPGTLDMFMEHADLLIYNFKDEGFWKKGSISVPKINSSGNYEAIIDTPHQKYTLIFSINKSTSNVFAVRVISPSASMPNLTDLYPVMGAMGLRGNEFQQILNNNKTSYVDNNLYYDQTSTFCSMTQRRVIMQFTFDTTNNRLLYIQFVADDK